MTLRQLCFALAGFAAAVTSPHASEFSKVGSPAVKIVTNERTGAHGSGVYIGGGLVVTAAHVVDEFETIEVVTNRNETAPAFVMMVDWRNDIAVLRLRETPSLAVAPLLCSSSPIGMTVSAIGNPLEEDFATANGRIEGEALPFGAWASVMLLRLSVAPGDSGGPVLDRDGNVVGIVVGQIGEYGMVSQLALAVPSIVPCQLLDRGAGL
jgi:S1-C subfamily serine protease